jgi:hypothetical protein
MNGNPGVNHWFIIICYYIQVLYIHPHDQVKVITGIHALHT